MPESYGQNSGTRSIDTPILWLQKMTSQPLYLQVSTHLNAQRRRNFGLERVHRGRRRPAHLPFPDFDELRPEGVDVGDGAERVKRLVKLHRRLELHDSEVR